MLNFLCNFFKRHIRFYQKRYRKNLYLENKRNQQNQQIYTSNVQQKVLICVHSIDWGGAERFGLELMTFLTNQQIEYDVFIEKKTANIDELLTHIQPNHLYYANKYQDSAQQLLTIIQTVKPTIIHINHSYSAYLALPKIARDIFIIDTLHIIEYQTGGYPYLSAKNSRYINQHHVISQGLSDYLNTTLGVPKNKITLGYMLPSRILLPKTKSFNHQQLVIGFLGRFEKQKRPELFIELAYTLHKQIKNVTIQYIMQGQGALQDNLYQLIQQYKLENIITILKPNNDINTFHDNIDILINPAENEGLTLVGIESVLKETIFISTDVGQQNEITDECCIVSANPNLFIQETKNIILNIISNPNLSEEIIHRQLLKYQTLVKNNYIDNILKVYY